MDIGRFKASRTRLILWMVLPPAVALGVGLSSYVLQLRSQWQLTQISKLSKVLPALVHAQQRSHGLLSEFEQSSSRKVRSEDQMISYLQEAAQRSGFVVDALKVQRSSGGSIPVLKANVKGAGTRSAIEMFLKDISTGQYLLSEKLLKLSRPSLTSVDERFNVEVDLELALFQSVAGGAK